MIIYTWNMQSAQEATTHLGRMADADVICLQEVGHAFLRKLGHVPGAAGIPVGGVGVVRATIKLGRNDFDCLCTLFGADQQNSVAVMVRTLGGMAAPSFVVPSPPVIASRALPFLQYNGIWFGSVHAPSANASAPQMAWITAALNVANAGAGATPWFCAGDYNAAPAAITTPPGAGVSSSGTRTQMSGGELDFAIFRGLAIPPAPNNIGVVSDHAILKWKT